MQSARTPETTDKKTEKQIGVLLKFLLVKPASPNKKRSRALIAGTSFVREGEVLAAGKRH